MSETTFPGFGFGRSDNDVMNEMGAALYRSDDSESQGPVELVPNPDFVFPPRDPETSAPSMPNWQVLNLQHRSSQHPSMSSAHTASYRRQRPSALPAFTFNPSASETATPSMTSLTTPPHSPAYPTTPTSPTSPRAISHRRGGSELIGGDGIGGTTVMSSSPTKGDGVFPAPSPPLRLGPPPGRRGHTHRRSGALSGHDMQSILQPRNANVQLGQPRGGSAPATPMDTDNKPFSSPPEFGHLAQATPRSSFDQAQDGVQAGPSSPNRRPIARSRVGFASNVEIIPRPLSTISSETESSLSTVRGHSAHESINSVLSGAPSSPPTARMARPTLDLTFEGATVKPRPQSAGNILDTKTKSKESFHLLPHFGSRPKSAHGAEQPTSSPVQPSTPAKKKVFSWFEHKEKSAKAQVSRVSPIPSSASEPSLVGPSMLSPLSSPNRTDTDAVATGSPVHPTKSPHKPRKEPRKSKSWGHSLWERMHKAGHQKEKVPASEQVQVPQRAPTPASASQDKEDTTDSIVDSVEPNFDEDNTVTIFSTPSPKRTSFLPDSPRQPDFNREDSASPVIDLDAALGPFNTPPLSGNARGRRVPPLRRSMHSLGASYNNHRRAESAPELPPFELAVPKKKPSLMEDVFEEENEDESVDETNDAKASPTAVNPVGGTENASITIEIEVNRFKKNDDGAAAFETEPITTKVTTVAASAMMGLEAPITPALDDGAAPVRGVSPVEVVESYEEPRASTLDRDSDSTITPTTPDQKEPQQLVTLGLGAPAPRSIFTPDTATGSTFSTPDLVPANPFDMPRLGTANSSLTDYRHFTIGESSHEVRMSVDDVPSLTSSRSTATNPANGAFRPSSAITHDAPRSSSVFSGTGTSFVERTRKRSSLASLFTRDRSKLNIESRPQSQHIVSTTERQEKKSKRLSKLMFWKSKKDGAARQ